MFQSPSKKPSGRLKLKVIREKGLEAALDLKKRKERQGAKAPVE